MLQVWISVIREGGGGELTSVDAESLFGFVSETAGLLRASGLCGTVDGRELTVLPSADAQQESHDVALLVAPYFFEVVVRTHGCCRAVASVEVTLSIGDEGRKVDVVV